jgi:triacylglycerol lipase
MRRGGGTGRVAAALAAALTALACPVLGGGSAQAAPAPLPASVAGPVQDNWWAALLYSVARPEALPAGANQPGCRPSAAHPDPVVLVNGLLADAYAEWSRLAPQLSADGYCVFAFDYGGVPGSPVQQTGPMRESGRELAAFVARVRSLTGARRVDLVGHSEGGLLGLYYINRLGGADSVARMVGVEPVSNGAHLYGLLSTAAAVPALRRLLALPCAACVDLAAGSGFVRETAEGGLTRPEVGYTAIMSATDGILTPDEGWLPPAGNVTDLLTQDACSLDLTDHVNADYDDITLRLVRNALDPAHARPPACHPVLPLLPPQV